MRIIEQSNIATSADTPVDVAANVTATASASSNSTNTRRPGFGAPSTAKYVISPEYINSFVETCEYTKTLSSGTVVKMSHDIIWQWGSCYIHLTETNCINVRMWGSIITRIPHCLNNYDIEFIGSRHGIPEMGEVENFRELCDTDRIEIFDSVLYPDDQYDDDIKKNMLDGSSNTVDCDITYMTENGGWYLVETVYYIHGTVKLELASEIE